MVKHGKFFEMKGIIESVEASKLPHVFVLNVKSLDGRNKASIEIHEDILTFKGKDKVMLSIHYSRPKFKKEDFLGVGKVVKIEENSLLISIGGFLVSIEAKVKPALIVGDKVYVKLSKVK